MVEVTRAQSEMTHFDPLAYEACVLYNTIAHRVLAGEDVRAAMEGGLRGSEYEIALAKKPTVPPDGFVRNTFLWVTYLVYTDSDFSSVVQRAANLGGDSDTIGAIAGGLAGLAHGYNRLPERYTSKILVRSTLDELAEGLLKMRG